MTITSEADAWAIFAEVYTANPAEIPQARADLEALPLWGRLEAVHNDRVFLVATDEWSGTDLLIAQRLRDTIEQGLTAALEEQP